MKFTTPCEMSKTVSQEISQILAANGHSVYHPVLVEQLTKYVDYKFTKAREEQEALEAANQDKPHTVLYNLYRVLNQAINSGEIENINIISQAIQRLS